MMKFPEWNKNDKEPTSVHHFRFYGCIFLANFHTLNHKYRHPIFMLLTYIHGAETVQQEKCLDWTTRDSSLGVKGRSVKLTIHVKNAWSYTTTPPMSS
jgi:hypothetical protein